MNKIGVIEYVDAFYTYEQDCPEISIKKHEAFGYYSEDEEDLLLEFIKKENSKNNKIIKGLIIPKIARFSSFSKGKDLKFESNVNISVTWKDIVYVANVNKRKSSTMNTEGIVARDNEQYVVIKNPTTNRIQPDSKNPHPKQKPNFYIIPKCLIIDSKKI